MLMIVGIARRVTSFGIGVVVITVYLSRIASLPAGDGSVRRGRNFKEIYISSHWWICFSRSSGVSQGPDFCPLLRRYSMASRGSGRWKR